MTVTVYLASPIDQANTFTEFHDIRSRARNLLREAGAAIYDPSLAWTVESLSKLQNGDDAKYIGVCHKLQESNLEVARRVDLVLVLSPPGVPSIGTPIDAYVALTRATHPRVAVWAGSRPWSVVWNWMLSQHGDRMRGLDRIDVQTISSILNWAREDR